MVLLCGLCWGRSLLLGPASPLPTPCHIQASSWRLLTGKVLVTISPNWRDFLSTRSKEAPITIIPSCMTLLSFVAFNLICHRVTAVCLGSVCSTRLQPVQGARGFSLQPRLQVLAPSLAPTQGSPKAGVCLSFQPGTLHPCPEQGLHCPSFFPPGSELEHAAQVGWRQLGLCSQFRPCSLLQPTEPMLSSQTHGIRNLQGNPCQFPELTA